MIYGITSRCFVQYSKGDKETRIEALKKVKQAGTRDDVSEFARILVKDAEINVSEDWFLDWFHPGAKQLYNQTHNLKTVISQCHDPAFRIGEVAVQVGTYASVVLSYRPSHKNLKSICERLRGDGDGRGIYGDTSIEQSESQAICDDAGIGSKYFLLEPKFDGERMQLHFSRFFDENSNHTSSKVTTFSRRGLNSSEKYAKPLCDVIDKSVNADSIILDGEIMIWDVYEDAWLPFDEFGKISRLFSRRKSPSQGAWFSMYYMYNRPKAENHLLKVHRTLAG